MPELLDRVGDLVDSGMRTGTDAFGNAKAEYGTRGRYFQMRVWVIAAFVVNAIVTLAYVLLAGGPAQLEASFEVGVLSNIIIIHNKGDALPAATITLDGRYEATIDPLESGANGLQVDREFRDGDGKPPKSDYRPKRLTVVSDGDTHALSLSGKPKGS